ncbi:MAG: hypothetical protein ABIE14_05135 [Patescibacteria group bacterium]
MSEKFTELLLRRCNNPPRNWGGKALSKTISTTVLRKAAEETKKIEEVEKERKKVEETIKQIRKLFEREDR